MSKPSRKDLEELAAAAERQAEIDRQVQMAKDKRRNQKTSNELRQLVKALERELDHERAAREMLLSISERPPSTYKIPKRISRGKKNSAVTVSCLSDVHLDEYVEMDEVNGRNEHTPEICDEKLKRYASGVVKLVKKEQSFHDVRTHVQWIGGDLFTGHIHDELIEATAMSPLEAVDWIHPRLMGLLRHLAENLDVQQIVVPWSFGNHGRDGKKPRITKAAQHNYEYLLALMLEREVAREPWGKKIKMVIEPGYLTYIDVGGYIIAFHHGDGLRYGGGVGGLTIPLNKAVDAWNKHRHADLYVNGHYHQSFDARDFVCNGSMIGLGQFSIRIKARPEPPQQVFFTIDLDRKQKVSFSLIHVLPKEELERFGWL